ncbi:hypothetical protein EFO10_07715 [Lactococcus cremoris]|nr:hypothetical protein [Lactococcus cremoris]
MIILFINSINFHACFFNFCIEGDKTEKIDFILFKSKKKRLKSLFPFFYSDFFRNTVIKITAISFLKSKSLTHRKSKIILLQEPKKAAYQ